MATADPIPARVRFRPVLTYAWSVFGPFFGLILVGGFFAWMTRTADGSPNPFLSDANWRTIAIHSAMVGVPALGMTVIMIAGGIDLSIGSVVALVTVASAVLVSEYQVPILGAMALAVLLGGLCGVINGALITGLGVVPFIVTLGTLKIFRGAARRLAKDTQVYILDPSAKPRWLDAILSTRAPEPSWLVVAPGVWLLLILALLLALALRYSVFGRHLYAVGSSEPTARLCGINVPGVKLAAYGLAGLATGVSGAMHFLSMGAQGDPGVADGLELQVIAAVVIGGGSLSGGEGTVLGTLIGCLILSVLNNGCTHAGYGPAARDLIIGAIIVAAVAIDRLRRRR